MGLLDLYATQANTAAETPLTAAPRTLGERIEATAAETFAPDRYFTIRGARQDMWQRAIDELHTATGESFVNPYAPVTADEMMRLGNQPAVEKERSQRVIEASRMARASGNDGLFDPENIDRYIGEEANRRRQRAAAYEGTGNGVLNFLAGAAIASVEPFNLLTMAVPVTRLPTAASVAIGETFLRNVAREAFVQGGANMGAQAVTEGLDYMSREGTGSRQTLAEAGMNVAAAGVFGALLGGGVRALHLKWIGLPEAVRRSAPLEVQDAFRVIEADALFSGQNRLGIDPLLHERYQGRAMDAIIRGQPVDLGDLARAGDTPMTALGTILRSAPEEIRVEGLATTLDRIKALPDSEIVPVLRQLKPETLKTLDDIERRSAELDARERALQVEREQIGIADVVDIDTGARLQDIEKRLAAQGLRRAERLDLERERDMILQSVDRGGAVSRDLQEIRRDFFPDQQRALAEIKQEREALERERASAESGLKREVDQLRSRLDNLVASGRFADNVGADVLSREVAQVDSQSLADAIAKADFDRQASIFNSAMGAAPEMPSVVRVYRDLLAAFENLGLPLSQARANAAVFAARYESRAERNPAAFRDAWHAYQQAGLKFERGKGAAGEGTTYNQSVSLRNKRETLKKYGLDPEGKYKTRDVAMALEARQRDKYGTIARDDRSVEASKKIAKWMAEEVQFEMLHPEKSGVGWYSQKFQRALDTFAEAFPELKTSQDARDLMTALIAITSDGQKVVPNFMQAADIYGTFTKTGKFAASRGTMRQASIETNLRNITELHDRLGPRGMRDYLLQEATVSDLKKLAKASGVSFETEYQAHIKMPMAAVIFGPKLGAFYANLMGSHGYLTMDRWWSRTFNRYRGTLLEQPTRQGLDRFKQLIKKPKISDERALEATKPYRDSYEAKGYKNGTETEKAANTLYKAAFENLEDQPFNSTDRTFMLDTVGRAQQELKKKGVEMSVADIQAVLWYYEKRLYGELGARQTADISYEEAAKLVANQVRGGPDKPGRSLAQSAAGADGRANPVGRAAEEDFLGAGAPEGLTQGENRGDITFRENETIIRLLKGADESTLIHEGFHAWVEELKVDAAHAKASDQIKADFQTMMDFVGNKGEPLTREQHEKLARAGEAYMRTGQAPSGVLAQAFEAFKEWLTRIYRRASDLGVEVSPELKAVFDRMLATDERLRSRTEAQLPGAGLDVEPRPATRSDNPVPGGDVEAQRALDTEVQRIMQTPGSLEEFKAAATKEMQEIDAMLKDAQSAAGCAMGAAL